jgi:hypothetical protein
MADLTITFTGGDQNPFVPAAGFAYTTGSVNGRIFTSAYSSTSGSSACVIYTSANSGNTIRSRIIIAATNSSDSCGAAISAANGNGYYALIRSGDYRLFRATATNTGLTQVGSTFTGVFAVNDIIDFERDIDTGQMRLYQNGNLRSTITDNTHAGEALRAGFFSRAGTAWIGSFTVYNIALPPAITSINSGNPITVGQTGVVIAHTGFSGAVTSVTTNRSGVTCAITAGDASSTTVTVSGWVEGGAYPVVDNTVTFTCTRGAESASATQTLTKPANYAQQTFSGAIIDDQNLIGYHLNSAGHAVEGGAFYYRTDQVSDLTVDEDTSWTSAPAGGAFNATFIPLTGTTAGNAYLFDITLLNGSIVSVQGLTSVGLTSTGLTQIGLTSVGLC